MAAPSAYGTDQGQSQGQTSQSQQQLPQYNQDQARRIQEQYRQQQDLARQGQLHGHSMFTPEAMRRIGGLSGNAQVAAMDALLRMSAGRETLHDMGLSWRTADSSRRGAAVKDKISEAGDLLKKALDIKDSREFRQMMGFGRNRPDGGDSDGSGPPGGNDRQNAYDTAAMMDRLFPNDPNAKNDLAVAQQGINDYEGAARTAQQAISLDPSKPDPYATLAQSRLHFGDVEGAAEAAGRALELDPRHPIAASVLRLTRGRENSGSREDIGGGGGAMPAYASGASAGDFRGFSAPASDLHKYSSGEASARAAALASTRLAGQAGSLLKQGDSARAEATAAKAIEKDPSNPAGYWVYAISLLRQKRFEEALRAVDAGLQYAPQNSMLWTAKAKALNSLRRHSEALEAAEKAIELDERNAEAYVQSAWANDGLGGRRELTKKAVCMAGSLNRRYQKWCDEFDVFKDGQLASLLAGDDIGGSESAGGEQGSPEGWAGLLGRLRPKGLTGYAVVVGGMLLSFGLMQWLGGAFLSFLAGLLSRRRSPEVDRTVVATPIPRAMPGPGEKIGAYQIVRQIGTGGMGVVYEGLDTTLQRKVAIKKMREEIRSDPRERERFLTEARTVAAMHHPNIVEIFSIVEERQDAYLIFEFVDGRTVHDMLGEKRAFTFVESVGILRGAAAALDYAHKRGVIHRDLKPSNIMINQDREVKVMDFGVARQAKDSVSRLSMTNTIVGTPPYMAPEQEQGMVKKASDVYALAVMLYELVTGRLPFAGVGAGMLMAKINKTYIPPSRVVSNLPDTFDAVMDKALDPDPEKRYQSGGEFLRALEELLTVRK